MNKKKHNSYIPNVTRVRLSCPKNKKIHKKTGTYLHSIPHKEGHRYTYEAMIKLDKPVIINKDATDHSLICVSFNLIKEYI